jgi:hypothetical protein
MFAREFAIFAGSHRSSGDLRPDVAARDAMADELTSELPGAGFSSAIGWRRPEPEG